MNVWELGQDSSSPIASIVLLAENVDTQRAVNACYPRRFQGLFPLFISMSQCSHQLIVVNSTCVNNTIILIDPISLTVVNSIYIEPKDFRMSTKLSEILSDIAPRLVEFLQKGQQASFSELFAGRTESIFEDDDGPVLQVSSHNFLQTIYDTFGGKEFADKHTFDDWKDLVDFLDQDNSGFIDEAEY